MCFKNAGVSIVHTSLITFTPSHFNTVLEMFSPVTVLYLQWFPILFSFPGASVHWPDTLGHFLLPQMESSPERGQWDCSVSLILFSIIKCEYGLNSANSLLFSRWSSCLRRPHRTLSVDRHLYHWPEALPWSTSNINIVKSCWVRWMGFIYIMEKVILSWETSA